ncbi:MAG TPA: MFS transporter [Candidatus Polarisedimenticolaceae bacterium]
MSDFHPSTRFYRFTVLFFAAFILFGSYFAYDSVGALVEALMKKFGVGREAIGFTYTMYSLAAIPTVFLGGWLVDRLGTRRASLLFSLLVTAGSVVVAFAPSIEVLYVGRLIFGMGSESLVVAQSAILARWFTGKELALAFGIALTVSRLGTLFTFNTEALLAERFSPEFALWTAAALCAASLVINLVYNLLDKKAEPVLKLREAGTDKVDLKDATRFGSSFWFVTLLCVTFYSAIFPFTALSTDFFAEKWGLPMTAGQEGGFLASAFSNYLHMFSTAPGTTSIIIFASMVFAPFAGTLVDKMGRRASLMIVGSLLMIPAHLALGLTDIPPAIPMIVLGAAFVLVPAAMWPSVPLVVEPKLVGTAFGLMTAVQNIGLMAFPWLNGKLRDATHGYVASQVMFASLGLAGLAFAILLLRADKRNGGALERPGSGA